jgi:acetylornithine deacetylase/succinyl-diaminopimelate desuccinylase-like protein
MSAERNAIELTRDLLRFDTINPTGDETACARYLGDLLADAGFRVSYYPYGERRTCVVAALGGSSGKRPLCITGHIDTVPLGAARWRSDPFAGESDGDRLFGRGSSDMKSGVAAFVVAALAFAGRLAGTPGIELVITGGEESGCEGAFHLARSHALGHAAAMLVAEPTANYPLVAHKGAFWLEARTHGVTAHGSMPERGDNAVFKAARAALALEHFEFGIPAHPLLGQPTLNVGTFHGGLNINSVPRFREHRDRHSHDPGTGSRSAARAVERAARCRRRVAHEARCRERPYRSARSMGRRGIRRDEADPRRSATAARGAVLHRCPCAAARLRRSTDGGPRSGRAADGASDRRVLRRRAYPRGGRRLRGNHSPLVRDVARPARSTS